MSELAKVLDKDGNDLNYGLPIKEVHANPDLLCETVHVWIYDPKNWVLLQKRSNSHPSDAGMWDISAAGHIDFKEEPVAAAVREIKEELGLTIDPAKLFFTGRKYIEHKVKSTYPGLQDYLHNEFVDFYFLNLDKDKAKINLQDSEVAKFEWLSINSFESEVEKPGQKKYVRFDLAYYQYVISELKKLAGKNWGEL